MILEVITILDGPRIQRDTVGTGAHYKRYVRFSLSSRCEELGGETASRPSGGMNTQPKFCWGT
jgi:hypothetical protein